MQAFVIDLLVVLIIAFFTWNGYRRGFFLTASSLLIFFASVLIGATVANANVERAAVVFDDVLDWVAETATEDAMEKVGTSTSNMSDQQIVEVIKDAFFSLGIRGSAAVYLAGQVKELVDATPAATLYETISKYFVRSLAWVALFFAGYVISSLLLSLIVNFVSTVFKLPVIRQLDMLGGLALGLVKGLFLLFLAGFALRYFGMLIPHELIDKTHLLRFFIDVNPFGSIVRL